MNVSATGQVSRTAADVYEEFFVPALFHEWAPRVADAGGIGPGQRVLDVACGTGVLTREVAGRVEPGGRVTGLDRNEGMLAVAQRMTPGIEWRIGMAEALPFEDGAFDAVVSQFGLMFFDDRVKALREMWRVLKAGGNLAVAVWDSLDNSPGYATVTRLLQRLFGAEVADAMRAPFVLGDKSGLHEVFAKAGIEGASLVSITGRARFASIDAWVHTDVKGWTLAGLIDDLQYEQLLKASQSELKSFVTAGGEVEFMSPAHIVSARKG